MGDYKTIQQHEPLRVPSKWTAEERKLIVQLEEILDDLYRRFNRLRLQDMGQDLRNQLVSTFDGVKTNRTAIEQTSEQIRLTAESVDGIIDGTTPVAAVDSTAVEISPTGFRIKTGGVFTVDSGNFELDENGNVTIRNASVAGNLSMGGNTVLTNRDILVSSYPPDLAWPGLIWLRPVDNVTLSYKRTIPERTSFADFNSGLPLTCQSAPAEASGSYAYRLTFPYRCTTTSALTDRTLNITLSANGKSITLVETLKQYATEGRHDFTFDRSFTEASWLGDASAITLTMTITGSTNPYNFHRVDQGDLLLTCSAIASGDSSGWSDAEVKVYQ